jgi:hypothetical protein
MDDLQLDLFYFVPEWLESEWYPVGIKLLEARERYEAEHGFDAIPTPSVLPADLPADEVLLAPNVWIKICPQQKNQLAVSGSLPQP